MPLKLGNLIANSLTLPQAVRVHVASSAPVSGTSGTGAGFLGKGTLCINTANGVMYVNEGSKASPYWTPLSFYNQELLAVASDFRDAVGKAHANTDAAAIVPGSGLRIYGDGVAETDSGVVVTHGEGGAVARLTTTDEDNHLVALGYGAVPFQPDTHGPLVVDVELSMVTAITLRRLFVGFVGTAADALVSPATGSTTTITLVQDDLAGLLMDAGLTDAAGLFAAHNKSDAAASIATTATGVDTGVDVPAAATYTRLRVEIHTSGRMVCFKDKVQIASIAAALDVDEEVAGVALVASTSTAVKAMDVKRFAVWGQRAQ